jgi:hypothetical protein
MGFCFILLVIGKSYADQTLIARKVNQEPVIDGVAADKVWSKAQQITTHDKIADIDMTLKAVYTDKEIFFLVSYPDKDESRIHRSWVWNKKTEEYDGGKDREDAFVLKWNMEDKSVDLSVFADNLYTADVWFWKACRTDPSGYADDKVQRLSAEPIKKAKEISHKSGQKMYLQRSGDTGKSAFKSTMLIEYKGDVVPRFIPKKPTLSRADIKAKGTWTDGRWTIEFGRKLNTGHEDDILLNTKDTFLFGVSRYEVAGRDAEPDSEQPLYGSGDVGERLTLKFSSK